MRRAAFFGVCVYVYIAVCAAWKERDAGRGGGW